MTGDIPAEWLRDAANQFKQYLPLIGKDDALRNLTRGVVNLQGMQLLQDELNDRLVCFLSSLHHDLPILQRLPASR